MVSLEQYDRSHGSDVPKTPEIKAKQRGPCDWWWRTRWWRDAGLVLLGVYSANAEITNVSGCKGISVKITLGSEIVILQLDTGAAVSIVPESLVWYIWLIIVNGWAQRNGMKLCSRERNAPPAYLSFHGPGPSRRNGREYILTLTKRTERCSWMWQMVTQNGLRSSLWTAP